MTHCATRYLLFSCLALFFGSACDDRSLASDAGASDASTSDSSAQDTSLAGDAGSRVAQGPLELLAQNESGQTLYVSLDWVAGSGFSCDQEQAGSWESCSFYQTGCLLACSEENKGQDCCVACSDIVSTVQEVKPGASYSYLWNGKMSLIDTQHCANSCPCSWLVDPLAGHYRVTICMSDSYTCINPPCADPDAEGRIEFAVPAGNEHCESVELDLPYAQQTLTITLD